MLRSVATLALVGSVAWAPPAVARFVQNYHIYIELADGGFAEGTFRNDPTARDRCPAIGMGCFDLVEPMIQGNYAGSIPFLIGPELPAPAGNWLRIDGRSGPPNITFAFNGETALGSEMAVTADFAFLGGNPDAPWNGDPTAIGRFQGGWMGHDLGYETTTTFASLTQVPLPAAGWLLGGALAGLALAHRRRRVD